MKIYIDNCALQRPLDDKDQIRIAIEAEAILGVISLCDSGKIELIGSDALVFEAQKTPNLTRKEYIFEVLARATKFIQLNAAIEKRAKEFDNVGIKPLDALHLSSAEEANADYFCTCDDRFLRKAKKLKDVKIKVVSPLELIQEIDK